VQQSPDGLAQALILGKKFLGEDNVKWLGGNTYFSHNLYKMPTSAVQNGQQKSKINVYNFHVTDPEHYGEAKFDEAGNVISLEEKPTEHKSNYAVTGLFLYE